jgi:hypothetical protein
MGQVIDDGRQVELRARTHRALAQPNGHFREPVAEIDRHAGAVALAEHRGEAELPVCFQPCLLLFVQAFPHQRLTHGRADRFALGHDDLASDAEYRRHPDDDVDVARLVLAARA